MNKVIALPIALALLAGLGVGVAEAAPSAPSGMQGLAKGRLVHTDGRPAAGATVTIYALPNETADNPMVVGESRTFEVIGKFRTDKAGRYAAAVRRGSLARHRDAQGNVNAELIARDSDGNIASLSIGLTSAAPTVKTETSLTPVAVADLTLADPATSVAKNSSAGVTAAGAEAEATTAEAEAEEADPSFADEPTWVEPVSSTDPFVDGAGATEAETAAPGTCGWRLLADMGNRSAWIGGTYVTTAGVTADLVYSYGSSSTLGVGVSASGGFGTFRASGTSSKASTATTNFPAHSTRQHAYTFFNWGKYGLWCSGVGGYSQYKATVRFWVGGTSTYAPPSAPTANYCVSYVAGSKVAKKTSSAYSFSTGADTSGYIGIDLSSQTGYTTETQATFAFAYSRRLCGTNDYVGGSPRRLVAKL